MTRAERLLPPGAEVPAEIDFVCPDCHGGLAEVGAAWRCDSCDREYPLRDGVVHFYLGADTGGMRDYTENFFAVDTARGYSASFRRVPRKRWRTMRELAVMRDLVGDSPGPVILNVPCGGGRLSTPLERPGVLLIEADSSPGQLGLNMSRAVTTPRIGMTASAFSLPLPDRSVDTVVCARLSHHLDSDDAREALLAELWRVCRGRLVFSFRDACSLQSLSRRLRGRRLHATAMSRRRLRLAAAALGARVARIRSVSNFGARHSYALLERSG